MRVTAGVSGSRAQRQLGLTLVELMITVSILALLLFLAMPNFRAWIQNARMRTVAEALQNGVRQSQAEAVRRNRTVVFYLTNDEPSDAAASAANGSNWGVRVLPLLPPAAAENIRGGAFADVAQGVAITGPAAICFNPVGQQVAVAAEGCAPAVTNYDLALPGAERRLRVSVGLSGRVRMCDRDKTLSAAQPDGC